MAADKDGKVCLPITSWIALLQTRLVSASNVIAILGNYSRHFGILLSCRQDADTSGK
jgi:hypothetical protein